MVINIVQGARLTIGVAGSTQEGASFSANANIVYPGNTTERPANAPVFVETLANRLPDNPDGSIFMGGQSSWIGSDVAVTHFAHKSPFWATILPNHGFVRNDTALGVSIIDYEFIRQKFEELIAQDKMGVAYLTSPSTHIVIS